MKNGEKYLSVKEASEELKVSTQTIIRLLKSGKISGGKVGNQWRIQKKSLENLFFSN